MKKLIITVLAIASLSVSCLKDDDHPTACDNLITPEMVDMAVSSSSSSSSFTGALMILPCQENSSIYYGNYNSKGAVSPIYAFYTVGSGLVADSPLPVRLPLGDYNLLYWGIPKNSPTDSTYGAVAISDPPLRIGADLAELSYTLRKNSPSDTTYFPVYDYVFAVKPIRIGTDKMQADMKRTVAGLKVTLSNHGGTTMDPSIATASIQIGSIANALNYFTAVPSDFSKTIEYPLSMSSDSLNMSANSTVMVFPSGESPRLTILLTLKNGQIKKFSKPLANALIAGNRLMLTITLGDLFSEGGPSGDFDVENWTETSETINFPAG